MQWYRKLHWQIILGLLLGLVFGVVAARYGWGQFTRNWIAPFGQIFMNLLKLLAVPLVLASLVTGVASLAGVRQLSRMGGKTVVLYLGTTAVAVIIGLLVVGIMRPGGQVPPEIRASLQQSYAQDAEKSRQLAEQARDRAPLQPLVDVVPENIAQSMSDNRRMLQVVFIALLLGIGLLQVPAETGRPLLRVFEALNAVIIRVVHMVMYVAPIGVFALMASTITTVAADHPTQALSLVSSLAFYCVTAVVAFALHGLLVYPMLLRMFTRVSVGRFYRAIAPAQVVAFTTSSSGATLPVTMECCEERLGVSREVSGFVLPLGATINMDGTAVYQAVSAVFIAQCLGMELGLAAQATIVLTALLASIGTAAVPGAGIVMLVIILEAVGIPTAGLALILGADRILDMLRTMMNVTGDAVVATIVASGEGLIAEPEPKPELESEPDLPVAEQKASVS